MSRETVETVSAGSLWMHCRIEALEVEESGTDGIIAFWPANARRNRAIPYWD